MITGIFIGMSIGVILCAIADEWKRYRFNRNEAIKWHERTGL